MTNYIEEIDTKSNIIEEYFRLYESYSSKYGKSNTILFLQVGSFHEAYQTLTQGFDLQKISDVLNIIVSKKNKSILEVSNKNPYMLGFPSITLPKFLKILIDSGFTVVIGDQITPPPNPKRAITAVYSPGTYIDENTPDTNNILSIYIEEIDELNNSSNNSNNKINLSIGLSVLDLTTGKSIVHEVYSSKDDEKICLDEAVRFMYSNYAKEIVITTNNLKQNKLSDIIAYLEISDKLYQHQTITQLINNGKKSLFKISYQQELLRKIYPNCGLLTPIEYLDLENLTYGRLSFIILLNYAYDHSHNIINNIHKPELYNESKYLNLGNNALIQLNLITFDKDNLTNLYNEKTQYKSLFDVINKTSTPMGRRLLKANLSQPLVDVNQIKARYEFIRKLISDKLYEEIERKLIGINDIEKMSRKIYLKLINPIDFYNWIQSVSNSLELFNFMMIKDLNMSEFNISNMIVQINEMLSVISTEFKIEELQKYFINDISGSIFRPSKYKDVDILLLNISKCGQYMDALCWGLSTYLDRYLKTNSDNQLIKIECNERDGHYLLLTKRRAEVLESILKKDKIIKFEYKDIEYDVKLEELEFRHLPKGNSSKIFIKEMARNSTKMLEYQDELKVLQKNYYMNFLGVLTDKYSKIIDLTYKYISLIDFLKSGAKVSIKYHYTLPEIESGLEGKSWFRAKQLRHPIIELLSDKEFIPTDIELGTEHQDGILLFGLNSAGKSSLQKSIGIAIIMAQIGYPVAAKKFNYYPYQTLFTRISANDNIFKGLSSFALEISELRAIIKRSNKNTLVIADEVCKGTEHRSSLIIVMTMLELLSQTKTSFITATHLHDIVTFERLKRLENIKMYHLHVEYDEKNNIIKYDRMLKSGSGDNFYGLNVAKFLIADDKFMNLANVIKKDVFEIPDLLIDKRSNYNKNVYMDKCHICGHQPKESEIPLETHHILFQKDFIDGINVNDNKYHINKNQKSNLVVLCYKCHDLIDNKKIGINGWIDTNSRDKLDWYRR